MQTITLTAPDDWHCHLRDGTMLNSTVNDAAASFSRAIVMPNLKPAIRTVEQAMGYYDRIKAALKADVSFTPLMTLYLTNSLCPDEIRLAQKSGLIYGIKWYPKGATTHSDEGVYDLTAFDETLKEMSNLGMPLLIHGEVVDPHVDIFDRETQFLANLLSPLMKRFPKLKIVLEHISTKASAEFVEQSQHPLAATITAHHLALNRNHLLAGGLRPHHYCLPILKRKSDQHALIRAATSGNPKFFLGTDSAPHSVHLKESSCGCAGIYSTPTALAVYTQIFEQHNALEHLESFASFSGADFYQLPRNEQSIDLIKKPWTVPDHLLLADQKVIPMMAGQTLDWQLDKGNYD